jgi:hypothetical protein
MLTLNGPFHPTFEGSRAGTELWVKHTKELGYPIYGSLGPVVSIKNGVKSKSAEKCQAPEPSLDDSAKAGV